MNFYQAVHELGKPGTRIIHVPDAECGGEKALISDGEIIWSSRSDGFVTAHREEILGIQKPGISEIDGRTIYSETAGGGQKLVICGAGHISMAMITMGKLLDFDVTVIDDRLQFVNNAIRQGADRVIFKEFEEGLKEVSGGSDTYFVIATRGHRYDRECLSSIVKKQHAYIGMLGSRRRVEIIRRELLEAGESAELVDSIHMPVGLKIGAETPGEIAVAIMAEIIQVKSGRQGAGFDREILDTILKQDRNRMVLATIISRKGSAPRDAGTKMLIAGDGSITGTIGGGCIEGSVIAKARRILISGNTGPETVEVDLTDETAEDEGLVCGGRVTVMLETV